MSTDMVSTSSRFVSRYAAEDLPWSGHVVAIEDALRNAVVVEFRFCRGDVLPWFVLQRHRGAVRVVGANDACLGVFASVEPALVRGWEAGGWAGLQGVAS